MRRFSGSIAVCWVVGCAALAAQQWPQFRGPQGSGVADDQRPPVSWNVEAGRGVVWKTPIPGLGHSSPVVWGDRLFLTTAISSDPKSVFEPVLKGAQDFRSDKARHQWRVYALDRATGKIVWDRLAHEGVPKIPRHPHNSYASATPATDGRHVVVSFGSEGLYCYSVKGDLLWKQDLGVVHAGKHNNPEYTWGTASSPILYRGMVIVLCDSLADGYLAAFDVESGREIWRTKRETHPSWSTPAIYDGGGRPELVTNAAPVIQGYDPSNGKELWRLGPSTTNTTPTPIVGEGLIFVANGYNPTKPIYAVVPGSRGDLTLKEGATQSDAIAWSTRARRTVHGDAAALPRHLLCRVHGRRCHGVRAANGEADLPAAARARRLFGVTGCRRRPHLHRERRWPDLHDSSRADVRGPRDERDERTHDGHAGPGRSDAVPADGALGVGARQSEVRVRRGRRRTPRPEPGDRGGGRRPT